MKNKTIRTFCTASFVVAMIALVFSCKKATQVSIEEFEITQEIFTIRSTSASITGTYSYDGKIEGIAVYVADNELFSHAKAFEAVLDGKDYSVEITDLKVATTYHYYYSIDYGSSKPYKTETRTFSTKSESPTVSTLGERSLSNIAYLIYCKAESEGGQEVTERGICWNTYGNPTLEDETLKHHQGGLGRYSLRMENLERSTTYYVRAYAKNAAGTGFGNEISFTTPDLIEHEYVDLGLPSGTLWATDDVNIDNQWGVFAWGETLIQPASNWYGPYNWNSYQYCNNSENTLTKYCNNSNYGYEGFTDPLTVLLPEDDAATINWGSDWRTPTIEEWMELYDNTTKSWTMSGNLVLTASNGNSLTLPSGGFFWDGYCSGCYLGDWDPYPGYYWSSSLYTDNPSHAWTFSFIIDFRDDYCLGYSSHERRGAGLSIRAVRSTP